MIVNYRFFEIKHVPCNYGCEYNLFPYPVIIEKLFNVVNAGPLSDQLFT